MMHDGYITPRRTLCSSPAGFGVPDTFCGHHALTQGLRPVLYYVTPSGFGNNHQLYHKLIPITPQNIPISIYHDCKHHHIHHPPPHTIITKQRCRDAPWCVGKHGETHPPMLENTTRRTHQGASLQDVIIQHLTNVNAKRCLLHRKQAFITMQSVPVYRAIST